MSGRGEYEVSGRTGESRNCWKLLEQDGDGLVVGGVSTNVTHDTVLISDRSGCQGKVRRVRHQ